MKCFFCKVNTPTTGYICDECHKKAANATFADEALAQTIKCRDCKQPAGNPCLTGSKKARSCAHAVRSNDAKRLQR
jgi:DNA-directed RNA polymerase subunit RPC12/RpoP